MHNIDELKQCLLHVWHGIDRAIITGRPAHSAAMPVLFLLNGPKMGFRHKCEIWHGERTAGSLPVPNFTFIREKMWEVCDNGNDEAV